MSEIKKIKSEKYYCNGGSLQNIEVFFFLENTVETLRNLTKKIRMKYATHCSVHVTKWNLRLAFGRKMHKTLVFLAKHNKYSK